MMILLQSLVAVFLVSSASKIQVYTLSDDGSGMDSFLKSIDFKEWQSSGENPEEHKSLYLSLRYGWNDDEDIASAEENDLINKATLVHSSKDRLSKRLNAKATSKAKSQNEKKDIVH